MDYTSFKRLLTALGVFRALALFAAFPLTVPVASAQAQDPLRTGPNFNGTVHVQSNFEGGGPTVVVENNNARGDTAVDFLSAGDFMGNIGWVTSAGPNNRFFVLQHNPAGLPLTLSEEGQGPVGIGTPNPSAPFHVRDDSGEGAIVHVENANPDGDIPIDFLFNGQVVGNVGVAGQTENRPQRFFILERNETNLPLTLAENGGNVGIGVADPSNILTVRQGSGSDPIAGAWTVYSSRRWKTNIEPIQDALNKVLRLRGVSFDWKKGGTHGIGLIAEEVGEVTPEVVGYEENGRDAKSVDYSRLVALLIEAIKEQQDEIDELEVVCHRTSKSGQ